MQYRIEQTRRPRGGRWRRSPSPAALASLVGLARMGIAARRFLRPDADAPPIDVRVVVPARNEAHVIEACVRSLVPQATDVVVVDDASSDGTGAAAEQAGARVLRLDGDPPPGWLGKPRACAAGAQDATTEWLAFVDADVVLAPRALAAMAAATASTSTSIAGGLECSSAWERLLLPELGLALVQEGLPADFASGQCFLVRRESYEAVGGHGHPTVRGSALEDRDLARVLGDHDARLAPALLRARMYRSAAELRRGLVKNQAALHARPLPHLLNLLAPVATRRPWAAMGVSAAGRAAAGQNPLYGLLAPAARLTLAALYIESCWRARTGRAVAWKGRSVPVPGPSGPAERADGPERPDRAGGQPSTHRSGTVDTRS